MGKERFVSKAVEWASAHRGTLIKVAAAAGAVIGGALAIRQRERIRDWGIGIGQQLALKHVGLDMSPPRAGEFFGGPGRVMPGGKLTEHLAPDHSGCVALITADKSTLLDHASRLDGIVAAAHRKGEEPWEWFVMHAEDPAAAPHPLDSKDALIGASLRLGDGATEAALGVATSDDEGKSSFVPVETTVVAAGPVALMGVPGMAENPVTFLQVPGGSTK